MNETIRFYAENQLADDIESFFKENGVEFIQGNFIQASDPKHRKKRAGRLVTIANTTIRKISEIILAYLNKKGFEMELQSEKDSVTFKKQNSVESIELIIQERKTFRLSLKIKR
jgi:hypothetical protein